MNRTPARCHGRAWHHALRGRRGLGWLKIAEFGTFVKRFHKSIWPRPVDQASSAACETQRIRHAKPTEIPAANAVARPMDGRKIGDQGRLPIQKSRSGRASPCDLRRRSPSMANFTICRCRMALATAWTSPRPRCVRIVPAAQKRGARDGSTCLRSFAGGRAARGVGEAAGRPAAVARGHEIPAAAEPRHARALSGRRRADPIGPVRGFGDRRGERRRRARDAGARDVHADGRRDARRGVAPLLHAGRRRRSEGELRRLSVLHLRLRDRGRESSGS